MESSQEPFASTGLTVLDLGVLSGLYDMSLLPSSQHAQTAKALEHISSSGLCASEDAGLAIRRLGSAWLLPLPLVDVHGNNGSQYEPPTQPLYSEVRLTIAGQLAVESSRGKVPPLPIGLINGDIHLALGVGFGRWRDRPWRFPPSVTPSPAPMLTLRPGFDPRRIVTSLVRLIQDSSVSDSELIALAGPPRLLPFTEPLVPIEALVTTGAQLLTLTPLPDPDDDEDLHPPADVMLSLGMPLPALLRSWLAAADSDTRPLTVEDLEQLAPADAA